MEEQGIVLYWNGVDPQFRSGPYTAGGMTLEDAKKWREENQPCDGWKQKAVWVFGAKEIEL
jgi:hypothetical protein